MPPVEASAGIRFGNYELIKRLAHGGMAEVYLARQRGPQGFDRRVAIKRILPHLADSEDFLRMFLEEARLAASLNHPNVVHIYELGKLVDDYFIAMEYIDGVHAGEIIDRGMQFQAPPALVARIGANACAGLDYVHRAEDAEGRHLRLVHRDISPPNLMISYDGVVKLMDFGIAKATGQVDLTRPGVVKGKFAYMSPEQTMGQPLDGRSDVFSLSLILWELLAGRVILPRINPIEAMIMIRDGKLPSLRSVRPGVPQALVTVLERGLQVDREQRPTAAELGNALEGFIKSSPELGTPMQLSAWLRGEFPRARVAEVAGGGQDEDDELVAADWITSAGSKARAAVMSTMAMPAVGAVTAASGEVVVGPAIGDEEDDEDEGQPTVITKAPVMMPMGPPPRQTDRRLPGLPPGAGPGDTAPARAMSPAQPMAPARAPSMTPAQPSTAPARAPSMPPERPVQAVPMMPMQAVVAAVRGPRALRIAVVVLGCLLSISVILLVLAPEQSARERGQEPAVRVDAGGKAAVEPTADAAPMGPALPGRLIVVTAPPGAEIEIAGMPAQSAPARFVDLTPGIYEVTIRLPGYHTEERSVEVFPGEAQDLILSLKPEQ